MVRNSTRKRDPIEAYFKRHPSFNHVPSRDWRQLDRFKALARHCGWTAEQRKDEKQKLKHAWTQVVESEFTGSSISHYQNLCHELDISPIPETVAECKNELKEVFVNIVDLVQYRKDRKRGLRARTPTKFDSLEELREYSAVEEKYYPKENAKAEMLRELLKELF
jgi:hypothetical protein